MVSSCAGRTNICRRTFSYTRPPKRNARPTSTCEKWRSGFTCHRGSMSSSLRPLNPIKRASLFSGSSRRSKAPPSKDGKGPPPDLVLQLPLRGLKKFCLFPTTFVSPYRTAESEIGSDQTQVRSVNERRAKICFWVKLILPCWNPSQMLWGRRASNCYWLMNILKSFQPSDNKIHFSSLTEPMHCCT